MMGHLQCDHCGDRPDHSVLQNAQFTPEEQHPDGEQEKSAFTNIHPSLHPPRGDPVPFPPLTLPWATAGSSTKAAGVAAAAAPPA